MAPFDGRSPCAADALFHVTTVMVNGKAVGISGLSDIIAEVRSLGLYNDAGIRGELVERVGRTNYIPGNLREVYADALLSWYRAQVAEKPDGAEEP